MKQFISLINSPPSLCWTSTPNKGRNNAIRKLPPPFLCWTSSPNRLGRGRRVYFISYALELQHILWFSQVLRISWYIFYTDCLVLHSQYVFYSCKISKCPTVKTSTFWVIHSLKLAPIWHSHSLLNICTALGQSVIFRGYKFWISIFFSRATSRENNTSNSLICGKSATTNSKYHTSKIYFVIGMFRM